jgi:PAS domain S-box-containing protein
MKRMKRIPDFTKPSLRKTFSAAAFLGAWDARQGLQLAEQTDVPSHWTISLVGLALVGLSLAWALWTIRRERLRLQASERQSHMHSEALKAAANAIMIADRRGTIEWINPAWGEMTGYQEGESLGRNPRILKSGMQDSSFYHHLWKTILAGEVWRSELVNRRKDGSFYYEEETITPLRNAQGRVSHFIAIKKDISERREAIQQLAASEARLRVQAKQLENIFSHSLDIICELDGEGRFLQVSEASGAIWGIPPVELLATSLWERVHPEDRAQTREALKLVAEGGKPTFENRCLAGDGAFVPMGWSCKWSEKDRVWFCIARDVRERKAMELALKTRAEELAQARDRAETADRAKSTFLATMSHELRTPLNSIIGFTGILLQRLPGPLNEEQIKQLEMVQRSARHLLALINDVLDISKIEAGELTLSHDLLDLQESFERVLSMIRPLAEKKGLQLACTIQMTGLGVIEGDQRRIEQVLINLLSNAVKFTQAGKVELSVRQIGNELALEVRDTGIGIPAEARSALFRPFSQVDGGLTRNNEGTGLGLTICDRLARLMGGSIAVESEFGKGSTFTFRFPFKGKVL